MKERDQCFYLSKHSFRNRRSCLKVGLKLDVPLSVSRVWLCVVSYGGAAGSSASDRLLPLMVALTLMLVVVVVV